jgi:hypothetical protein
MLRADKLDMNVGLSRAPNFFPRNFQIGYESVLAAVAYVENPVTDNVLATIPLGRSGRRLPNQSGTGQGGREESLPWSHASHLGKLWRLQLHWRHRRANPVSVSFLPDYAAED